VQQDVLGSLLPIIRVEIALEAHPVYETFGALPGVDEILAGMEQTTWSATAQA
jgi:hypothetical protein